MVTIAPSKRKRYCAEEPRRTASDFDLKLCFLDADDFLIHDGRRSTCRVIMRLMSQRPTLTLFIHIHIRRLLEYLVYRAEPVRIDRLIIVRDLIQFIVHFVHLALFFGLEGSELVMSFDCRLLERLKLCLVPLVRAAYHRRLLASLFFTASFDRFIRLVVLARIFPAFVMPLLGDACTHLFTSLLLAVARARDQAHVYLLLMCIVSLELLLFLRLVRYSRFFRAQDCNALHPW